MSTLAPLGFFARLGFAFSLFFKVVFDGLFAARAAAMADQRLPETAGDAAGAPGPATKESSAAAAPPRPQAVPEAPVRAAEPQPAAETSALQLLSAVQREGRFLDFVKEDVATVADGDLAGVARLVHAGCRRVVDGWFTLEPVWPGEEGAKATVPAGYDGRRVRLTGNVTGEPPFTGTLTHHGWRASAPRLPTLSAGSDPAILAPAEVEL